MITHIFGDALSLRRIGSKGGSVMRHALLVVLATICSMVVVNMPRANASPFDNSTCGTQDAPPCAPAGPLTPEQMCGLFTAATWIPCNWTGMQVPEGTPGTL